MSKNVNWIIMADPLEPPFKGGPLILHHLANKFLSLGDRVLMNNPFHVGSEELTIDFLNDKNNNLDEWVAIVTENDFRLEEFKLNNVVRYILYKKQTDKNFNSNEFVIQYGNSFTMKTNYEFALSIKPVVTDLDFWKDLKKVRTNEFLILEKKGKNSQMKSLFKGRSIDNIINEIDTFNNIDLKLRDLFNEHKLFISFDNDTFHSIQASLCGAISVVIPDGTQTEQEWRNSNKSRKWGIAYGFTIEQIKFAKETAHKLREFLHEEVKKGEKDLEILREIVLNKFY